MNDLPLVSIIIPCYNYGNFLGITLKDVLEQEYANWECIIVDDGSVDNTRQVAEGYTKADSRFSYVYQKNSGLSAARNTGIKASKGKYLQLLDADDLIEHTKLSIQTAYLEKNEQADVVYGDSVFFRSDEEETRRQGKRNYNNTGGLKTGGCGKELIPNLLVNNFIEVSAPLIRSSVFDKVGTFDTTYFTYEDWHFWFRCAFKGICLAYEPLAGTETYIRYGHSSMLGNIKKKVQYGIMLRRFVMPYLPLKDKLYNLYRLTKLLVRRITGK